MIFFLCHFLHAKLRKRLMQGVPEKRNKQLIKTSRRECLANNRKKYRKNSYLMTHIMKECQAIGNTIQSMTSVCRSQSRQWRREQEKREKIMQFSSRKMYETKQKAIICVLVGEQQFCRIFPSS